MTASGSWIKLHRSMARHPLWLGSPFTIGQAWVDLLMLANYHESLSPRGDLKIDRGQVLTSIEALGRRWGRDKKTVRGWLLDFARAGMLTRASAHGRDGGYTLLTLLNYEQFQGRGGDALDDGLPDGLPNGTDDGLPSATDDGTDDGLPPSEEVVERQERKERVETRARARTDLGSSNGQPHGVREVEL